MLSMASAPTWMTIESGRNHAAPCAINASTACLCCIMSMVTSAGRKPLNVPCCLRVSQERDKSKKREKAKKDWDCRKGMFSFDLFCLRDWDAWDLGARLPTARSWFKTLGLPCVKSRFSGPPVGDSNAAQGWGGAAVKRCKWKGVSYQVWGHGIRARYSSNCTRLWRPPPWHPLMSIGWSLGCVRLVQRLGVRILNQCQLVCAVF